MYFTVYYIFIYLIIYFDVFNIILMYLILYLMYFILYLMYFMLYECILHPMYFLQVFLVSVDQCETWFTNKEAFLSNQDLGVRTT